ncbi:MAG: hypothetical protein ACK55Z_12750 [bacterium]
MFAFEKLVSFYSELMIASLGYLGIKQFLRVAASTDFKVQLFF